MTLPSSLYYTEKFHSTETEQILDGLRCSYSAFFGVNPEQSLQQSWKGSIEIMKDYIPDGIPIILEYIFPIGLERVDLIAVGHRSAYLIEAKGWNKYQEIDNSLVYTDIGESIHPCYQLENYLNKFKRFHTASEKFHFDGSVFMYRTVDGNKCDIFYKPSDFVDKLKRIENCPAEREDIEAIIDGKFHFSRTLVDFVRGDLKSIMEDPTKALVGSGYGLSEEQMRIKQRVLNAIKSKEKKIFLVNGKMGSGKTLLAVAMLFEAISKGECGFLAYRNNRLINTLRTAFGERKDLLQFYSVGRRGNFTGLAEENFDEEKLERELDFVIYDEAQRMREDIIERAMARAAVTVFFYDEDQTLIGDEVGTGKFFRETAQKLGKPVEESSLSSVFRLRGGDFAERFLKSIWNVSVPECPTTYDFRIFRDFILLIKELRILKDKREKVALVASFTKSSGRERDKVRVEKPRIEWLMDPKTEYPKYWIEQKDALSKCASIYGCQGFEADYVGVIWGNDLIWKGEWIVNSEEIKDTIGEKWSLKSIAEHNPIQALKMLKNRYNILLSRGIKGVYLYFEDETTRDYVATHLKVKLV